MDAENIGIDETMKKLDDFTEENKRTKISGNCLPGFEPPLDK